MAKRKLSAAPLPDGAAPAGGPTPMGGMWGGTALNMLRERLREASGSLVESVANGTTVVEIEPSEIDDLVGSDRMYGWQDDDDIDALAANIRRRGQRQAIRIRPLDPDWTPDPDSPTRLRGRFAVQSGRRRMEACRRLGLPVRAVISTDIGDARLGDLEERWHENTMRRSLTGFEELLSIGMIAGALPDLSQQEIAERLSVSQNDVSLGKACVDLHDVIVANVDVATTPKRAYREIVPKLRARPSNTPQKSKATQHRDGGPNVARDGPLEVELRATSAGLVLKVKGSGVQPTDRLAEAVAAALRPLLEGDASRD